MSTDARIVRIRVPAPHVEDLRVVWSSTGEAWALTTDAASGDAYVSMPLPAPVIAAIEMATGPEGGEGFADFMTRSFVLGIAKLPIVEAARQARSLTTSIDMN